MPLSADPKGGGTEADGSKNADYCSFCYQNGAFTDPTLTLETMTSKLEPIMTSMNIPADVVESTKAALPHLKRWITA